MIVLLFPNRANCEAPALDSNLTHQAALYSVLSSQFYSFAWPYVPAPSIEEFNAWFEPPANPGEQRKHSDARRRDTFASNTRDCYQRQSF